ncbi:PilN domain-containing protein [Kineococcus sp. R86509]|uniref:PilN domain-containing protein n=1 Tax=Kineococcus sp. R86509 TaxID=3093851 RepID=UPI0036D4401A
MSFQTLEAVAAGTRTVRVNLLPPEYTKARGTRRLRIALVAGVVLVAGACGAAGVISAGHVSDAQAGLDAEQSRTSTLRAAQAPYAEVPAVLEALSKAQAVQTQVQSSEIPYYRYVDLFAANTPADLTYTSLAMTTNAASTVTSTTADPLAAAGIASVTVSAVAKEQSQIATWMDQVNTIPGVTGATLLSSSLNTDDGTVTFNATATLTDDALLRQQ